MKIKHILIGLFVSSGILFSSCGEGKDEEAKEKKDSTEKDDTSKEETSEVDVSTNEEVDVYSVQGQWNDIVTQIQSGNTKDLEMYLDYSAPTFSEEEWNYLDFSDPLYGETFASYESFDDLPEAEYFAQGARVVEVYFEFEDEGMVFESMAMIYFVERNGLLWIIGSSLVG